MGFLRELFGPSKDEVWQQLCREIGGSFAPGGLARSPRVQVQVEDWILTLDTWSPDGKIHYTRLRAPYLNPSAFGFRVYRRGVFTELGKRFLGVQDIEVGDSLFDEAFVIQGNDVGRVRRLFANPRIRSHIERQPSMHLEVKDDEGWFEAHFPAGVDELCFLTGKRLRDLERLRGLFDFFVEVLNELHHMDSDDRDAIVLHIRALLAPGGRVEKDGATLWAGDAPRRRAADELAHLKDPRAVPALITILDDPDLFLHSRAIRALGEIGDRAAVPALIPLLGEAALRPCASRALGQLGASDLADRFAAALAGDRSALQPLTGAERRAAVAGLVRALEDDCLTAAVARALATLAAVEALPALRSRLRRLPGNSRPLRSPLERAIAELEQLGSLVSPADGSQVGARSWLAPADAARET